jgi:hypothetical protein
VQRILDPGLPVAPVATTKYAAVLLLVGLVLLPAGPRPAFTNSHIRLKDLTDLLPQATVREPAVEVERSSPDDHQPAPSSTEQISRSVAQLGDPASRHQAVLQLQSFGVAAEPAVIHLLGRADAPTRMAAYDVLTVIGDEASKEVLQAAFLKRSGPEQFTAQRALNAVTDRVRLKAQRFEVPGSLRVLTSGRRTN